MKKSLLIVALAFTGSTVMAQQAPTDGAEGTQKTVLTKKLDVKKGLITEKKAANANKTIVVNKAEATLIKKKSNKLNIHGSK